MSGGFAMGPGGAPGYPAQSQYPPQGGPGFQYPQAGPGYPQAGSGYPPPIQGYPQAGPGYPHTQTGPMHYPQSTHGYPDSRPSTGMQPTFATSAMPTSTVELSVSCKKLTDKDLVTKSDPMCILYMKCGNGDYVEVGRTEVIKDNLNPSWKHKFVVDYRFEERQFLKFEVYDSDSKSSQLKDHDFVARMECTLGAVVSAPGRQFVSIVKDGPSKGAHFVIVAEEVSSCKDSVRLQLSAKGLENKDTLGKSDPFFILSKMSGNGQFSVVHRSEVIKNNLNPTWREINIPMRDLCNGDRQRKIKVEVFDSDDTGNHDLIGSFTTTANDLESCAGDQRPIAVINTTKQSKKKSYKNSGEVIVKAFRVESATSFMDYIQGGTALNFSVAVDFTASNGDPRDSQSLHFRQHERAENQYTTAIRAVGSIVEDYDADRLFPALGFGGKVPPHGNVSHEFFLNLRQDNPYCVGTEGIVQAYLTALNHVTLYGPTNFSPVINHVARFASSSQDGKQYFVLLIITDGIITDLDETRRALVDASSLPMSVIVVGVGNEDFSTMVALDSDSGLLRDSTERAAARDIVQFVELRKFVTPGSHTWSKELLAQQVLAEIPKQLVGWMSMRGIKPVKY